MSNVFLGKLATLRCPDNIGCPRRRNDIGQVVVVEEE